MIKNIMISFVMLLLTGCGGYWKPAPPQREMLEGLANQGQVKVTNNKITGASKLKLAIVNSANVQPQIQAYAANVKAGDTYSTLYSNNPKQIKSDEAIIYSDKAFMESIVNTLKSKFGQTFYANDLVSAFKNGADYVVVIDIRLDYLWKDGGNRMMDEQEVANIRALFINQSLIGGPDVIVNNTNKDMYEGKGFDANVNTHLNNVKKVRLKSLQEFETSVSKVVIQ